MHIGTKKMATLGILLSMNQMLLIFSSFIELSTFFILALAAYLVGVAVQEAGYKLGSAFYAASILLGFILTPNKLYWLTYIGFGTYIICFEGVREFLIRHPRYKRFLIPSKYIVFNIMYLPLLFLFPSLFFTGKINTVTMILLIAGGQFVLYIYDRAYFVFVYQLWRGLKRKLHL
ncbi:MAG: hypothetical protein E7256_16280 [Lachnospiraceae bacterium]|nr:hypothetical protein [Lachnospiraceae bacterium]